VCLGKWQPCLVLIKEEACSPHIHSLIMGKKTLLTDIKELPEKQG